MGTFFITAVTQCEWKTLPPPRYAAWFGKFNDFLKADSSRRALCLPLSEEVSRWRMGWHGWRRWVNIWFMKNRLAWWGHDLFSLWSLVPICADAPVWKLLKLARIEFVFGNWFNLQHKHLMLVFSLRVCVLVSAGSFSYILHACAHACILGIHNNFANLHCKVITTLSFILGSGSTAF